MSALARVEPPLTVSAYDQMCAAIEACTRFDEAMEYQNKATALEAYYRQARNVQAERKCAFLRVRAAWRCGNILCAMREGDERQKPGDNQHRTGSSEKELPTLADLGITKKQSHEWQRLAKIPWAEIEASLSSNLETHVSIGGMLRDIEEVRLAVERVNTPAPADICQKCRFHWDNPELVCPRCGGPAVIPREALTTIEDINWDGYVRMVQLHYDGAGRREFDELEQALRVRYGTKNPSTTVLEALRREAAA
jgi:hypothetical protein